LARDFLINRNQYILPVLFFPHEEGVVDTADEVVMAVLVIFFKM
jgi:hypothetical protein